MLKKIVIAAALVVSTGTAIAADSNPFYAGVDLGSTKVDNLGGRKTGFGGFVGYQFNPNLAVEGGYRRLASYTISGVDVDLNQAHASVVGTAPLGNGFSVYGRLGYNKINVSGNAGGKTATASTSGGMFGLGAAYSFSSNVSVRAEFQRPSSDATTFNVGLKFDF